MTAIEAETDKKHRPLAERGSLEQQAVGNASLQSKIQEGRALADEDLSSIEQWARAGFSS